MVLEKLSDKEIEDAARLLSGFWTNRGMPQYDKKWAYGYLKDGHKKEIKQDEFFVFKEHELIGIISLVTDISNVAEIRDMVVKTEFRGKGYGMKMLQDLIRLAKKRKIRKLFALVLDKHENMYESAGFVKEGNLKSHFAAGEDLTIMSRFLE